MAIPGTGGQLFPLPGLSLQEEVDAIVDGIRDAHPRLAIECSVAAGTLAALGTFLRASPPPAVLHFVGHGSKAGTQSVMILEGEDGVATRLSDDSLRFMLRGANRIPCAVAIIAACHSEQLAEAFAAAGVPHVIGVAGEDAVLGLAARAFARGFYGGLFNDHSISDSFAMGKISVYADELLQRVLDPRTHKPVHWQEAVKFLLLPGDAPHDRGLGLERRTGALAVRSWQQGTNLQAVSADPFIGRRLDLVTMAQLLARPQREEGTACLALCKMGGMGKTALAKAVGRWQHERGRWRDGVWFIDLRNIDKVAVARARIAAELSVDSGKTDQTLVTAIGEKEALLILDDLDALLTTATRDMSDLLNALLGCRKIKLLITARQLLPGTVQWYGCELQQLDIDSAREMFLAYARARTRRMQVERSILDAILGMLDGYPFPIKLAATYAYKRRCSLERLHAGLQENMLRVLQEPNAPRDRETSFDASLGLSYSALPVKARELMTQLALFPGGLTDAAATGILGRRASEGLETLLQYSMVELHEGSEERRFGLPEPARIFAKERLAAEAEESALKAGLDYFTQHVRVLKDAWEKGQKAAGRVMGRDIPNIQACIDWGIHHDREHGICRAARLMALSGFYWRAIARGQERVAEELLRRGVGIADQVGDLNGAAQVEEEWATLLISMHQEQEALKHYELAFGLFTKANEVLAAGSVMRNLGDVHRGLNRFEAALECQMKALDLFKSIGAVFHAGLVCEAIGRVYMLMNDRAHGGSYFRDALKYFRAAQYKEGIARLEREIDDQEKDRA